MSLRQLLPWLAVEFTSALNEEKSPETGRSQSSELFTGDALWLDTKGEATSKSYRDMSMSLKSSSPKSNISELVFGSLGSSELLVVVVVVAAEWLPELAVLVTFECVFILPGDVGDSNDGEGLAHEWMEILFSRPLFSG